MAYVNVAEWNPDHVGDWLRGLEDEIQPYTQFFVNNKINGCQLLTLARDDLVNLNMTKIGHQELVLEAVELLRQLHYNLTSETLQSLALKLGCKAQSLFNDLKRVCQDFADSGKKERVSVETLSAVSDIINLVKSLISWLDRYPFAGQENYMEVRRTILKLSVELASTAQRDQFAENPHKIIKEICLQLTTQSDKIVQEFNDSLIIQPASLEVGKIKCKADDDLGIHINSLYSGVHIIENIKYQSPAYRSGKVEEGDEIVQVNYQTVIGWQIKNIICAMKEHPTEVHLTLKKRPRHPNVLGQVITLWPYRIPSKKTAFRKLYKWSKGKGTMDIRDMCPKSPGARDEINSVSEANTVFLTDKEKLFAMNKPRSRLRRRATVTGVSPTALQAPISLEELMDGSHRRKESVLRTISYDPNKTIDLEDNVFKKDLQNGDADGKDPAIADNKDSNGVGQKKDKPEKSTFLKPPTEKLNTAHLKRQEALKNSETVPSRPSSAKPSPLTLNPNSNNQSKSPTQQSNCTVEADSTVQETPVSGNQSPKQKFAEWVNRQKKKQESGILQHALSMFSQDGNSQPLSPTAKECGSPKSPKCQISSPKVKKNSGNIFQFSLREGRPSLSELRALKKTANSKAFSERVDSNQGDKNLTSPKQTYAHRRNQIPTKRPANTTKPNKEPQLNAGMNEEKWTRKQASKITDTYFHPKLHYSRIPQYPCEMHESKIVSLKPKPHLPQAVKTYNTNTNSINNPSRPNLHYQQSRQIPKPSSTTLLRDAQKSGYPTAFYSASGRSLSFNNIAMSSDDDDDSSSEDEYEIYAELQNDPTIIKRQTFDTRAMPPPQIDPNFARQLTEVYNMISQRQNFLQSAGNNGFRNQMNPQHSAVIDELALRMYHALQMNHMQKTLQQGSNPHHPPYYPPRPQVPSSNNAFQKRTRLPSAEAHMSQLHPAHIETQPCGQKVLDPVKEHPVDLPPSVLVPPRHINPGFKSATSQEIHNLYTSQVTNKHGPNAPVPHENEKHDFTNEYQGKDHTYETIPYDKMKNELEEKKEIDIPGKCTENVFLCPAEKEFESELPSKDEHQIIRIPKPIPAVNLTNLTHKTINDNLFCPIKPSTNSHMPEKYSAFKVVATKNTKHMYVQSNGNVDKIEPKTDNFLGNEAQDKNMQPTISSLMMSIPKPPVVVHPVTTKSSSSQTDIELCDSTSNDMQVEESKANIQSLSNDESFSSSLNSTKISIEDNPDYSSSSSSLHSSSSGSSISSSGSCYYYIDSQSKPQQTLKLPVVTIENDEDSPLIDLRSPTLPTMGVSMLSKKRCSSGSEQGSNAGSRESPNIPTAADVDAVKNIRIVTDVEQMV